MRSFSKDVVSGPGVKIYLSCRVCGCVGGVGGVGRGVGDMQ